VPGVFDLLIPNGHVGDNLATLEQLQPPTKDGKVDLLRSSHFRTAEGYLVLSGLLKAVPDAGHGGYLCDLLNLIRIDEKHLLVQRLAQDKSFPRDERAPVGVQPRLPSQVTLDYQTVEVDQDIPARELEFTRPN
jgi:hypothetical protein